MWIKVRVGERMAFQEEGMGCAKASSGKHFYFLEGAYGVAGDESR